MPPAFKFQIQSVARNIVRILVAKTERNDEAIEIGNLTMDKETAADFALACVTKRKYPWYIHFWKKLTNSVRSPEDVHPKWEPRSWLERRLKLRDRLYRRDALFVFVIKGNKQNDSCRVTVLRESLKDEDDEDNDVDHSVLGFLFFGSSSDLFFFFHSITDGQFSPFAHVQQIDKFTSKDTSKERIVISTRKTLYIIDDRYISYAEYMR